MDAVTRRRFLGAAVGATALLAPRQAAADPRPLPHEAARGRPGPLCLFSKHLPGMDAPALGRTVKSLGFEGVDLTVRPGGHVAPERAAAELPPFVEMLRGQGAEVPMITTGLVSAEEAAARAVLETAGRLRIPFFKPGYRRYAFADARREVESAAAELRGLARLSAECGVELGFHNHAGYIGGPVWDIAPVIEGLDPRWVGYYFDVRHAVVEGGDAGWRAALERVAPRLKMVAIKDFFWDKGPRGWRQRHCPLGEGMVDWKTFFAILARTSFRGPVSLHLEYEMTGTTAAAKQENTLAAAARDLARLRAGLAEAYLPPGAS
ncbi:MAG TPA: sugar phosphate isomerase/epimerase family protein [Vicinamibacteria bacterium]|nr:sugar phosphate isomerase/epimerase family protein [Vicinamibacteria bacterium]